MLCLMFSAVQSSLPFLAALDPADFFFLSYPYLGRTYPRSVSQLTSVSVGLLRSEAWHFIFSHCSSATHRSFAALAPAHRFMLSHFAYVQNVTRSIFKGCNSGVDDTSLLEHNTVSIGE